MALVNIMIGGDICPVNRNLSLFKEGDTNRLFGDLLPLFASAECVVANLECPLIEQNSPIRKTGPVLGAESGCVRGLAPFHLLGLANNHVLDHGPVGLENTLRACAAARIPTCGAGPDLSAARRIHVLTRGPLRIGFLAMAEQEWSIAGDNSAGANPLDLIDCVRNIQRHRQRFDFLVVLLHGGTEYYPYPSPRLMDTCRFMVEQGANVVVCQHSHCVGCYEAYLGGHIVYGQGNLLFDSPGKPSCWNEGILVRVSVQPDLSSDLAFIPFIQSREQPGARRMAPDRAQHFLKAFANRSHALADKQRIADEWLDFCQKHAQLCLTEVFGHGPLWRRLDRNGTLLKKYHSEEAFLNVTNLIRCESHRELALTVLERKLWK
jgi:poly-gamma-glutamate capsule biosynthesis protein CapA/YwtB (metallophosphatase superfamily)